MHADLKWYRWVASSGTIGLYVASRERWSHVAAANDRDAIRDGPLRRDHLRQDTQGPHRHRRPWLPPVPRHLRHLPVLVRHRIAALLLEPDRRRRQPGRVFRDRQGTVPRLPRRRRHPDPRLCPDLRRDDLGALARGLRQRPVLPHPLRPRPVRGLSRPALPRLAHPVAWYPPRPGRIGDHLRADGHRLVAADAPDPRPRLPLHAGEPRAVPDQSHPDRVEPDGIDRARALAAASLAGLLRGCFPAHRRSAARLPRGYRFQHSRRPVRPQGGGQTRRDGVQQRLRRHAHRHVRGASPQHARHHVSPRASAHPLLPGAGDAALHERGQPRLRAPFVHPWRPASSTGPISSTFSP